MRFSVLAPGVPVPVPLVLTPSAVSAVLVARLNPLSPRTVRSCVPVSVPYTVPAVTEAALFAVRLTVGDVISIGEPLVPISPSKAFADTDVLEETLKAPLRVIDVAANIVTVPAAAVRLPLTSIEVDASRLIAPPPVAIAPVAMLPPSDVMSTLPPVVVMPAPMTLPELAWSVTLPAPLEIGPELNPPIPAPEVRLTFPPPLEIPVGSARVIALPARPDVSREKFRGVVLLTPTSRGPDVPFWMTTPCPTARFASSNGAVAGSAFFVTVRSVSVLPCISNLARPDVFSVRFLVPSRSTRELMLSALL